jgi:SAM-dependent methyltransferase
MPDHVVEYGKGGMPPPEADGRLDAGAFHRNHAPIWSVLSRFLAGRSGDMLEIGSGTGQHAVEFSRQAPAIAWWPTDLADSHLRSIEAWRVFSKVPNLRPPVRLDASQSDWRLDALGLPETFIAIFSANVIHIAPWSVAQGLLAGAGRHLAPGGHFFLYGPFRRDGVHNSPGNEAFDKGLRAENPAWGVRDTADLKKLGEANRLRLVELAEMPANNAILIFERPA